MVPDLWNSRGESTTSKVDFYPGNMQERLARGTKLVVRYEVIEKLGVEWRVAALKFKCMRLWIGSHWRLDKI